MLVLHNAFRWMTLKMCVCVRVISILHHHKATFAALKVLTRFLSSSAAPCWCCSRTLPWRIAQQHRSDPTPLPPQRIRLQGHLWYWEALPCQSCGMSSWGFRSQCRQYGNKCLRGATVSSFSCLVWTLLNWWQWIFLCLLYISVKPPATTQTLLLISLINQYLYTYFLYFLV